MELNLKQKYARRKVRTAESIKSPFLNVCNNYPKSVEKYGHKTILTSHFLKSSAKSEQIEVYKSLLGST